MPSFPSRGLLVVRAAPRLHIGSQLVARQQEPVPLHAEQLDQCRRTRTAAAPPAPLLLGDLTALRAGVQCQLRAARTWGGHLPTSSRCTEAGCGRPSRAAADSTDPRVAAAADAAGTGSWSSC